MPEIEILSSHSAIVDFNNKPKTSSAAVTFRAWNRFWRFICACCYFGDLGSVLLYISIIFHEYVN